MIDRFVVRCRVTGANLPDPFMMNTEIAIQWERKKAIEVIADILSNAYGYDFDFDAEDDEAEQIGDMYYNYARIPLRGRHKRPSSKCEEVGDIKKLYLGDGKPFVVSALWRS